MVKKNIHTNIHTSDQLLEETRIPEENPGYFEILLMKFWEETTFF